MLVHIGGLRFQGGMVWPS